MRINLNETEPNNRYSSVLILYFFYTVFTFLLSNTTAAAIEVRVVNIGHLYQEPLLRLYCVLSGCVCT